MENVNVLPLVAGFAVGVLYEILEEGEWVLGANLYGYAKVIRGEPPSD